jgi:hypothetical protein
MILEGEADEMAIIFFEAPGNLRITDAMFCDAHHPKD